MLSSSETELKVKEITVEQARSFLKNQEFVSAVGHSSTAEVLSRLLDIEIVPNRVSIKISKNDQLLVFQLLVRLEEGRVLSREELLALPFKFYLVEVL
jgi:hypothetical protein